MRSPESMDIIVLDITNRCFLACSNCTRLVAHQTKTREMTPGQLVEALHSLRGWWKPGKIIGLIGGEPTLHSKFKDLCKVVQEEAVYLGDRLPTFGREPIADFNAFAEKRLYDRTTNRFGLWTSFGPRFMDHYEVIMDTFGHWNPNDHTASGLHQSWLIDRKETCDALSIDEAGWIEFRDNCWVQNKWSASITPKGAYFCEVAGAIDMLYNDGAAAWPVTADWWKRKPADFKDQLHLCERCSMALPTVGEVDHLDRDVIGKGHRISLATVGSPAVKGQRFTPAEIADVGARTVETADSYTNGPRVASDNPFVKPKRLAAVVVCVGRAEHLKRTLKHNAEQVDQLVVVVAKGDPATWDVVRDASEEVPHLTAAVGCVAASDKGQIERFQTYAFNKGFYLNCGLAAVKDADWVVLTDADVYLSPHLKEYVGSHSLSPGVLYGTWRFEAKGSEAPQGVNVEPNGYFQLFNRRADALKGKWPLVMSESFCSAGGIDSWFMQQWPEDKRVIIPELAVMHIPHGEFGAGWNGTPGRECWFQVGTITANGVQMVRGLPKVKDGEKRKFRLTDTLHGNSVVYDMMPGEGDFDRIVRHEAPVGHEGWWNLIFNGKNIGRHHIHLAAWGDPDERPRKPHADHDRRGVPGSDGAGFANVDVPGTPAAFSDVEAAEADRGAVPAAGH